MIVEAIATGKDVNEAIENGCTQIGFRRDEVEFEIISLPKRGLLGIKKYPAKVRVYREVADPSISKKKKPAFEPASKKECSISNSQHEEKKNNKQIPDPKVESLRQENSVKQIREQAGNITAQKIRDLVEVEPDLWRKQRVEEAVAYLKIILSAMGLEEIKIEPRYYTGSVCIYLEGSGLGIIIGRRGETLDAIQYLTSLVANLGHENYIRLNIDSGNYRQKREKSLIAFAKKLATHAAQTGKSTTLEPMNPYERRIIHGAVSQVKGANSSSIGVEPNRCVVISPSQNRHQRGKDGSKRCTSNANRSGRNRNSRSNSNYERQSQHKLGNEIKTRPQNYPQVPLSDMSKDIEGLEDLPRGVPIIPGTSTSESENLQYTISTPKIERSQEELETTQRTSLYGKIDL